MIVLLSTHIVEDVRDLCSNMAIMSEGQIISQGIPSELMKEFEGKIWQRIIKTEDLETFKKAFNVLSTHLYLGKIRLQVLSDNKPESGFELVNPDLEDVYFSTLNTEK